MPTTRSAILAGKLSRSAADTAKTVLIPRTWHARMIRTAISPRLATRRQDIFFMGAKPGGVLFLRGFFRPGKGFAEIRPFDPVRRRFGRFARVLRISPY